MVREDEIRARERAIEWPAATDAGLVFVGVIRTPWTERMACPRQGRHDGPLCRIEVFEPWRDALDGIDAYERLEVLYWLHRSRRDIVLQSPRNDGTVRGAFSLRTPVRPGLSEILCSGAIVTPMEGAHGHQEGHTGSAARGA